MKHLFLLGIATLLLTACATNKPVDDKPLDTVDDKKELTLTPQNFSSLPGWNAENFIDFAQSYNRSCDRILKKKSQSNFGRNDLFGRFQNWQIACRKFQKIDQSNAQKIRQFFEQNFMPYSVAAGNDTQGLFTGYFEASLRGSRYRHGPYQTPLRARPDDLVMLQLGEFRDSLKGQRLAGRVINGRLKPYETHAQIINGGLPPAQDKALVWVDSAIDKFFLQIQGSGIVRLNDGSIMRVGYAGQNGHPYYAIGRELIKRGALTKENVSMQSIRQWLENNPTQAQDIMTTNKSYVFFRELDGQGPLGGEGVALTAGRSLAIDRSLIPYGMPVWLRAEHPARNATPINRLMVTQDTGGAIRGPVRGDYFWGYGDEAEAMAGVMKSQGRYWFLMPKTL